MLLAEGRRLDFGIAQFGTEPVRFAQVQACATTCLSASFDPALRARHQRARPIQTRGSHEGRLYCGEPLQDLGIRGPSTPEEIMLAGSPDVVVVLMRPPVGRPSRLVDQLSISLVLAIDGWCRALCSHGYLRWDSQPMVRLDNVDSEFDDRLSLPVIIIIIILHQTHKSCTV